MKRTNRFITILIFIFLYIPMAVLVNADTYSAAEIFAAELQEKVGAAVVGVPTTGKGYSQILFPLTNGGAVGLSTAEYFTGEGVSLIEWANLIEEILPEHYTEIKIEKDLEKGFDYRRITIE